MLAGDTQLRFNVEGAAPEEWNKPVVPLPTAMASWTKETSCMIWAGVGSGTMLVSSANGHSWQKVTVDGKQTSDASHRSLICDGRGFVLRSRGTLLR